MDTMIFFKGDKPVDEFESGMVLWWELSTFQKNGQNIALQDVYEKKPVCLKFYEALDRRELQLELKARGIEDYSNNISGRCSMWYSEGTFS